MKGGSPNVTGIAVFYPPIQRGDFIRNATPSFLLSSFFCDLSVTRKSDGRRQKKNSAGTANYLIQNFSIEFKKSIELEIVTFGEVFDALVFKGIFFFADAAANLIDREDFAALSKLSCFWSSL
ncbi:hypothetical protein ACP179_23750 (plasmid) [Xenorhabdus stockiae]|uniref:hypothetical protein n=1 Tax=Xenorhabdus stockiae TaxID=351614 RepID=UPI003CED84E1